jgi:hypothetical protein
MTTYVSEWMKDPKKGYCVNMGSDGRSACNSENKCYRTRRECDTSYAIDEGGLRYNWACKKNANEDENGPGCVQSFGGSYDSKEQCEVTCLNAAKIKIKRNIFMFMLVITFSIVSYIVIVKIMNRPNV